MCTRCKMPDDKVLNPATGRWVLVSGKIGKELLKKQILDKEKKQLASPIKASPIKEPKTKVTKTKAKAAPKTKATPPAKQLDTLDQIKTHLESLSNIKLSTEKYVPFLPMLNEKTSTQDQTILVNKDSFIQGFYNKKQHFVIQDRGSSFDLTIRNGDAHILIKNVKQCINTKEYPCDIFTEKGDAEEMVQLVTEFINDVFGSKLPTFTITVYKYTFPSTYQEDKTVQQYIVAKPPATISVLDQEYGQYDPCFVSNKNNDILYVFHVEKTDYRSMKGYVPLGVSVVHREKKKTNYKYTTFFRLTLPSWAICDKKHVDKISDYMQEIRNVIISVPFLAKFRGIAPYPRTIIGQVGQKRNELRSCTLL